MAFPDSLPDSPVSRAKNRRPYGREYPVSKVEGNFLSIQDAIDAAVADGFGPSTPAVVVVYPGVYTEDLTLNSGIDIKSAVPFEGRLSPFPFPPEEHVVVDGTVTYSTATTAGITIEKVVLHGFQIRGPDDVSSSPAISFSGANPQTLVLTDMRVTGRYGTAPSAANQALEMLNTNVGSRVYAENSSIEIRGSALVEFVLPVVSVTEGTFVAVDTQIYNQFRTIAGGASVSVGADATTVPVAQILEGSSLYGGFIKAFGNTGTSIIRNCLIEVAGTGPGPVDAGNGGTLYLIDLEIDGDSALASSVAITGTASITPPVIQWSNLAFTNKAYGFDQLVNHAQLPDAASNRLVDSAVSTVSVVARPNEIRRIDTTTAAAPTTVFLPKVGLTAADVATGGIALIGTEVEVKEVSGLAGIGLTFPLTVAGSGGDLIDGVSTYTFTNHRQGVRFMAVGNADGTGLGWVICPSGSESSLTCIQVDTVDATPSSTVLFDLPANRDAVYLRGFVTARASAADDKVLQTIFEGTFIRTDSAGAYPANISIIGLTNTISLAVGFVFTTALIGTTGGAANEITMTLTGEAGTAIAWTICVEEARLLR